MCCDSICVAIIIKFIINIKTRCNSSLTKQTKHQAVVNLQAVSKPCSPSSNSDSSMSVHHQCCYIFSSIIQLLYIHQYIIASTAAAAPNSVAEATATTAITALTAQHPLPHTGMSTPQTRGIHPGPYQGDGYTQGHTTQWVTS